MADLDIEQGGSGCPDIGTDLLGGSAIGNAVRVRDMGPDTAHEEGAGRIPQQDDPQADRAATAEGAVWRLNSTPAGGCHGRFGFSGGGDLYLPFPEHSSAIYCD